MKNEGSRIEKKPKLKTRTKFTILSIISLTWFCIAVLVISSFDHVVPDTLIVGWFAAWTAELALLFGIKIKSKED